MPFEYQPKYRLPLIQSLHIQPHAYSALICSDSLHRHRRLLSNQSFSEALGVAIRDKGVKIIRLSAFTRFQWDEVFLFAPYAPRGKVCDALGVQAKDCEKVLPIQSDDDGVMTIAFRYAGKLVNVENHSRVNGDFEPIPLLQPLLREQAVFQVEQMRDSNGNLRLRLVLQ